MLNKVFIIEDQEIVLSNIERKLALLGLQAIIDEAAHDTPSLIKKIIFSQPSFTLMNLSIKKFNPSDLINYYKSERELHNIPILGYNFEFDHPLNRRCVDLGFDHCFIKEDPSVNQLVLKVFNIIKNKQNYNYI